MAPDRHGHGIGRALLDHADAVAAELGLPELRLYTHVTMTENRAIYRRLGFRETGRRTVHGYDRVFFARTVRGGEGVVRRRDLTRRGR